MTQRTIMIVSRDEDVRVIFGVALSSAGYGVRLVADPDAVLEAVRDADPALVITNHPTLLADGRTVTQTLRALASTASIPVISATSHVLDDDLERARVDGVDVSVALPLAPTRLVAIVQETLARRPARPIDAAE